MDQQETPDAVGSANDEGNVLPTKFGRRTFLGGTLAAVATVALASQT